MRNFLLWMSFGSVAVVVACSGGGGEASAVGDASVVGDGDVEGAPAPMNEAGTPSPERDAGGDGATACLSQWKVEQRPPNATATIADGALTMKIENPTSSFDGVRVQSKTLLKGDFDAKVVVKAYTRSTGPGVQVTLAAVAVNGPPSGTRLEATTGDVRPFGTNNAPPFAFGGTAYINPTQKHAAVDQLEFPTTLRVRRVGAVGTVTVVMNGQTVENTGTVATTDVQLSIKLASNSPIAPPQGSGSVTVDDVEINGKVVEDFSCGR